MKIIKSALTSAAVLLGLSLLSALPAQAYTLTASGAGVFVTATAGAVTFNNFDGINLTSIATVTGGALNNGSNPSAGGNWLSATNDTNGVITIQFTGPQSYFGLYWGTNDGTGNLVNLYNGATLLTSIAGNSSLGDRFWNINAVGPDVLFNRIVLSSPVGCCFEVDNFAAQRVVGNNVPEPATLLLTGLGLLGLAARRRKQTV